MGTPTVGLREAYCKTLHCVNSFLLIFLMFVGKSAQMRRAIVYIDGFNLYYGIRSLKKPALKWMDVELLAKSFLNPSTNLEEVKYFTAMTTGNIEKEHRQKIYLDALKHHCPKLTIVEGHFLEKGTNCYKCGYYNRTYEEKKTDVNIACEMLADAYEDRLDIAFLVSGDSDLAPPVEKVMSRGKAVIVASPPKRKSQELNQKATGTFNINTRRLKTCLLPAEISSKNGKISVPKVWRN